MDYLKLQSEASLYKFIAVKIVCIKYNQNCTPVIGLKDF